jgi:formylglycine-generating enzyme required for sulfatase activity
LIFGYDVFGFIEGINLSQILNSENVLNVGVGIVVVMLLLAIKDLATFKHSSKAHENYRSSIISLGIFGTFFGIITGLWHFDTTDIEGSVPALLDGLKTAFLTSFVGMGLTTLLGIFQEKGTADREKSDTEQLLQSLLQISHTMRETQEMITEEFQTLSETISQNSRSDSDLSEKFESLQKSVIDGNREIVEAIKGVEKIDEKSENSENSSEKIDLGEIMKSISLEGKHEKDDSTKEELQTISETLKEILNELKKSGAEENKGEKDSSFEKVLEREQKRSKLREIVNRKADKTPLKMEEMVANDHIRPSLVKVESGSFSMGSDDGRDFEKPPHRVSINYNFYVGRYLVTFDEYDKFCEDTKKRKPKDKGWGRGKRPVINISWDDAKEYAVWLSEKSGKRFSLLSEAEWEYIARAGTSTKWSFGDNPEELDNYGWYYLNSGNRTHPVGEKRENGWNIYDLYGNVWEWCEDDWSESYEETPVDGTANLVEGSKKKVIRGGAFFNFPDYTRSVNRSSGDKSKKEPSFGFRLKMEI